MAGVRHLTMGSSVGRCLYAAIAAVSWHLADARYSHVSEEREGLHGQ
jgi:hypothetical protein